MSSILNNEIGMSKQSNIYSPTTLITGQPPPAYYELDELTYGEYVELYMANNVTNTMEPRTISAIALHPSGNLQNGWNFMSLDTGRILHRNQWTRLSTSNDVIQRVNEIAKKERQPLIASNFKYIWGNDTENTDNDDNNEENPHASTDNDEDTMV